MKSNNIFEYNCNLNFQKKLNKSKKHSIYSIIIGIILLSIAIVNGINSNDKVFLISSLLFPIFLVGFYIYSSVFIKAETYSNVITNISFENKFVNIKTSSFSIARITIQKSKRIKSTFKISKINTSDYLYLDNDKYCYMFLNEKHTFFLYPSYFNKELESLISETIKDKTI
ncbi:hypothetical protein QVZ41_13735 [Wenyingzhuangia sp. chi5]|uniref:YcxB-like protein domain-containing protein n=1 Tax=Wenyingzhuangia gilva TaxID=3057677 RepID=A0ABT8VVA9_9FLAO|nr:hypothetical protein [Wenyingzhuangia sp. chi5]MDO3695907.1 hypothetical protein [Wenyingzhuangia sp. chi5]